MCHTRAPQDKASMAQAQAFLFRVKREWNQLILPFAVGENDGNENVEDTFLRRGGLCWMWVVACLILGMRDG